MYELFLCKQPSPFLRHVTCCTKLEQYSMRANTMRKQVSGRQHFSNILVFLFLVFCSSFSLHYLSATSVRIEQLDCTEKSSQFPDHQLNVLQ